MKIENVVIGEKVGKIKGEHPINDGVYLGTWERWNISVYLPSGLAVFDTNICYAKEYSAVFVKAKNNALTIHKIVKQVK